jgi:hypothetical protein
MRTKPLTAAESNHMGLVKSLPCCVCEQLGLSQTSPTDCHHIKRNPITGLPLGAIQKGSGFTTIPLCGGRHHWNGVNVHMGSKDFEQKYGNELDLLAYTYKRLGIPCPFPEIHK